jgi:hypothetical protein
VINACLTDVRTSRCERTVARSCVERQVEALGQRGQRSGVSFVPTHVYVGDRLAKAESRFAGQICQRVGPWRNGKAIMQFIDGTVVICLAGNGRILTLARYMAN